MTDTVRIYLPEPIVPLRSTPWPASSNGYPWETCRICGLPWRKVPMSRLEAHALCIYRPEDREAIRALSSAGVFRTDHELAAALGITTGILRAILTESRRELNQRNARFRYRRDNPEVSMSRSAYDRVRAAAEARGVALRVVLEEVIAERLDAAGAP